jgi:sugar lactone lactonase YvrE
MSYAAPFPFIISSKGATASLQQSSPGNRTTALCRVPLQKKGTDLSALATIPNPGGITTDAQGFIYITEATGPWIHRISADGNHHRTWATKGETNGIARATYGLAVFQGFLYLSYSNSGKIVKIDLKNPAAGETIVLRGLVGAFGLAVYDGFLYIASYHSGQVIRLEATATNAVYKSTLHDYCRVSGARGICFDSQGALYIAAYGAGTIFRYNRKGPPVAVITGLPVYVTDLRMNSQDELYISFNSTTEGVRKYDAGLESYSNPHTLSPAAAMLIWGISLTPGDSLLVAAYNANQLLGAIQHPALYPTHVHTQLGDAAALVSFSRPPSYITCTSCKIALKPRSGPDEAPELSSMHLIIENDQIQLLE